MGDISFPKRREMADLHCHLGQSVRPAVLWSIAHAQGIRLPTKDYWQFHQLIAPPKKHLSWKEYHKLFYWTELIQSSPSAMEQSVYEVISGAYRKHNITLIEISFNPMFRNRGGERDLDQIILASLRGMERALIEFPQVRACLIFLLDRRLSFSQNKIIVEKAIKYQRRGVLGIDIAGPQQKGFRYEDYVDLYWQAKKSGLKTTIHTGEDGTVEEMDKIISLFSLDRVVHGIKAYQSKKLMKKLVEKNITLTICPSSNMKVGFVKNISHLGEILRTLWDHQVKFCISSDNPVMLQTNVVEELNLLRKNNIFTEKEIDKLIQQAFAATFINFDNKNNDNLYL